MNERAIFLQALKKGSAADRAAYLTAACAGDAALRLRVEQLLHSRTETGILLDMPALAQAPFGESIDILIRPRTVTKTICRRAASGGSSRSLVDGRWVFVSAEYRGRAMPSEKSKGAYPCELLFKRARYGILWAGKRHEGSLRVDSKKTPCRDRFHRRLLRGSETPPGDLRAGRRPP